MALTKHILSVIWREDLYYMEGTSNFYSSPFKCAHCLCRSRAFILNYFGSTWKERSSGATGRRFSSGATGRRFSSGATGRRFSSVLNYFERSTRKLSNVSVPDCRSASPNVLLHVTCYMSLSGFFFHILESA